MSDLAKRLLASIRLNAINGDSQERAVCERQMAEAARVLGEQAAENERLRAENERLKGDVQGLMSRRNELVELLQVEQQLALLGNPFRCQEIECARYGQKLFAGDCRCFNMQSHEHRIKVQRFVGG